jgi:hypothetical protein
VLDFGAEGMGLLRPLVLAMIDFRGDLTAASGASAATYELVRHK